MTVNDVGEGKVGEDHTLDLGHAAMEYLQGHPVTDLSAGLLQLDSILVVGNHTRLGPQ